MAWQDREKEWDNLQATQRKLGEAAMIWSAIDRCFDDILADYLDISPGEVAAIVEGTLAKKKIEIIRRLQLLDAPSPDWSERMEAALKLADNFGEIRNRLIHDNWRFEVEKIERVERRAKKGRRQSREPQTLIVNRQVETTLDQLDEYCSQGHAALQALDELRPDLIPFLLRRREMLANPQG